MITIVQTFICFKMTDKTSTHYVCLALSALRYLCIVNKGVVKAGLILVNKVINKTTAVVDFKGYDRGNIVVSLIVRGRIKTFVVLITFFVAQIT